MKITEDMIVSELRTMIDNRILERLDYYLNEADYPADIVLDTITGYVKEKVNKIINEKEHKENIERAKEMIDELYHFCDKNNIVMRDKCTGTEIFEIELI